MDGVNLKTEKKIKKLYSQKFGFCGISLRSNSYTGKVSKDRISFLFMGPLTTLGPTRALKFFAASVSIHQIVGRNISQRRILQYR